MYHHYLLIWLLSGHGHGIPSNQVGIAAVLFFSSYQDNVGTGCQMSKLCQDRPNLHSSWGTDTGKICICLINRQLRLISLRSLSGTIPSCRKPFSCTCFSCNKCRSHSLRRQTATGTFPPDPDDFPFPKTTPPSPRDAESPKKSWQAGWESPSCRPCCIAHAGEGRGFGGPRGNGHCEGESARRGRTHSI